MSVSSKEEDTHPQSAPHGGLREPEQSAKDAADQVTQELLSITVQYHGQPVAISLPQSATISDLSTAIDETFSIPPQNQKILISPKPGLQRPPFKNPSLPLASLNSAKFTLIGSTTSSVDALNSHLQSVREKAAARSNALRAARSVKPTRYVSPTAADAARYTFARIEPLPYLPDPAASTRYLHRLASDPGITAAMRAHRFSVGLLTEMDPAMHTTHESRTLGLNRNRGEVIELRLRTDAGDGYRDYKVIRKTLCHELAHNVWGEHDGRFWALMREIEEEVRKADWKSGGQRVGLDEFSRPGDEIGEDEVDGGGWTGGSFVLGSGDNAAGSEAGMTVREKLARAAEERMKKSRDGG